MKPLIQINDEVREMNDEEFAEYEAAQAERESQAVVVKAAEVRAERNQKLKDSDFSQLPDSPVDKAAWATYREELRNIPEQDGFPNEVAWPVQP